MYLRGVNQLIEQLLNDLGNGVKVKVHIVIFNFVCYLVWATGYPNIPSNIILGIFMSMFLDEINS